MESLRSAIFPNIAELDEHINHVAIFFRLIIVSKRSNRHNSTRTNQKNHIKASTKKYMTTNIFVLFRQQTNFPGQDRANSTSFANSHRLRSWVQISNNSYPYQETYVQWKDCKSETRKLARTGDES